MISRARVHARARKGAADQGVPNVRFGSKADIEAL
jgi:hypothetical protein